jgi:tRNA-uridine 2-sulfurtransferase
LAKVVVLFSGSLASRVAAALVQRHPEVRHVQLLHFRSPFAAESEALRDLVRGEWAGTALRTQSLKREYRRFVESDGSGFSLRNTCLQCRALLLGRSARYLERVGADYLVTGERLGRYTLGASEMSWLAERYGIAGRVLRPLCHRTRSVGASLATWSSLDAASTQRTVSDDDLAATAGELGLSPHNPLASCGRCKLTLPGFGERVANLFGEEGFTLNALRLLDFTYYYKIEFGAKVVLAVDEEEKRELQNLFLPQDLRVYPATPHGPMALVRADWGTKSDGERGRILEIVACIVATHTSGGRCASIPVYYRLESDDETLLVNARALGSTDELGEIPGVLGMALLAPEPAAA